MTKKQRNQYLNYYLNKLHFWYFVINMKSSVQVPDYEICFYPSLTITLAFKTDFKTSQCMRYFQNHCYLLISFIFHITNVDYDTLPSPLTHLIIRCSLLERQLITGNKLSLKFSQPV